MAGISVPTTPATALVPRTTDVSVRADKRLRVNVDAPAKATVKQTTNIAVWGNTVRIVLEPTSGPWTAAGASLAHFKAVPPVTLLMNAFMKYDDFRTLALGDVLTKPHWEDPEATMSPPRVDAEGFVWDQPKPYVAGWTARWWEEEIHDDNGGVATGLDWNTARDSEHNWVQTQPPWAGLYVRTTPVTTPPTSGRMLRLSSDVTMSMDAISEHEASVDLKVRFRLWEKPGADLRFDTEGNILPTEGNAVGTFGDSSNQVLLILSMDTGLEETDNPDEVYGYALRNNWFGAMGGMGWEIVKFRGVMPMIGGTIATWSRERVYKSRATTLDWKATATSKPKSPDRWGGLARGALITPRAITWKRRRYVSVRSDQYDPSRPDQQILDIGDGFYVEVLDTRGQHAGPEGMITWDEIPGMRSDGGDLLKEGLQGQWVWARMKKTGLGNKVQLQAKVWVDGYDEPADWTADVLDDTPLAIQGGHTGIGRITPIGAEPGSFGGPGLATGPVDIDQVLVEVPQVLPGTSLRFEIPNPIRAAARQVTPKFINTGQHVGTTWDEYPLNQPPGDWYLLRPEVGPAPDPGATTNQQLIGKPMPPDNINNFLVYQDPELHPGFYESDLSDRSLRHTSRDHTVWVSWDPDDQWSKSVDPDMPRDALAWNEPYPGGQWLGHDGQIDDAEVLIKYTADTLDQAMTIWLRASGAKGYENGYAVTSLGTPFGPGGGPDGLDLDEQREFDAAGVNAGWRVSKFVNGERVDLGTFQGKFKFGEWHWLRLRIEGSSERQADRMRRIDPAGDWNVLNNLLDQPHDMYPYGGVKISGRTWIDGEDESNAVWGHAIDDGFNPDPINGFSGYRKNWDEYHEYLNGVYDRYRPVVPPWDRGFFAIGGPSIGTIQRYAEIHVLSPRIPRLDSSSYEGVRNLLDVQTAIGDASKWTAENVQIQTVAHSGFGGGQALEIIGTPASAGDPNGVPLKPGTSTPVSIVGPVARVVSNERIDVTAGEQYIALATLDNFQAVWKHLTSLEFNLDKYRGVRVGLRWFDSNGNVVAAVPDAGEDTAGLLAPGGDSLRQGYTYPRPPGRGPLRVGHTTDDPTYWLYQQYLAAGFKPFYSNPVFGLVDWFDMARTDEYGDPYEGWAFPADKPQPFRFKKEWLFWAHGGNQSHFRKFNYHYTDADGVRREAWANYELSDSAGWSKPMLHVAPEGAVQAAVVIEIENNLRIQANPLMPQELVVTQGFIGGVFSSVPGRGPSGYRDERYRVGEIAVFPAIKDAVYESWNVQPGQFALPPAEPVENHAHFEAFEATAHGHATIAPEPMVVTASAFTPQRVRATKPQYARPVQDLHDGSWTRQDGSQALIWAAIDDLVADDADYAQSAHMPDDDLYVAQLARVQNPDPDSDEKYLVHLRYRRRGATPAVLRVGLYQGEVPIVEWEEVTDKTFATVVRELTPEQMAAIDDYADLRVRLTGDVVPI